MAAVRWTDEQAKAIETADRGVVVPAAAGSGKTAVLIERTVRLLADKASDCPSENLLAVTFTKAAASQMSGKLRAALAPRIVGETDPQKREWLERQQDMLPLARISTINSFCLELVKDNLNEFDYRAGIRIADELQAETLLYDSLRDALEEMYEENPEGAELLIDALTNNSEDELYEQVKGLYNFLRSLAFPEEWMQRAQAQFTDPERMEFFAEALMYDYNINIEKAVKLSEKAAALAKSMPNGEKTLAVIASDMQAIESVRASVASGRLELLAEAVSSVKYATMRAPSDKGLTQEESLAKAQLFEHIKALRESFKNQIKSVAKDISSLGGDISGNMAYAGEIFRHLCDMCRRTERIAAERKLEQGIAEFNDIERMAVSLLVKRDPESGIIARTPFAEQIVQSRTYRMILIDEFQDVNNLQELIFKAISDTDDLTMLGKNVFVVGDVKQSIYRFRLSNPRLFINAVRSGETDKSGQLCKIRLTKNFRSRRSVIDYVNYVFANLMSDELGELAYNEEERLVCGASYGGSDPATEYMLIDDEDENEEYKYVLFGTEELCVARKIREMIDGGVQVWDGAVSRRCAPQDFCVLSRNKNGCTCIAAALDSVGLKTLSEQTDGYMGSKEIVTMVSLLNVIDNPMKDMSMAAVMMSPILGFTADETAEIRLMCRENEDGKPKRLFQIITGASKSEGADDKEAERIRLSSTELEDKCKYAAELIRRLRFYSVSMPLEALISKIYDETGFFAVASVYENSRQKRANLRLLSQRAAEYEKNSTGGISGFLRYLESVSAAGKDFSQAVTVSGGGDSVAVKTIHSSKGLEYPFVFLINLGKEFNMGDVKNRLLMNEQMGIGINYMKHDKLMNVRTVAHKALEVATEGELLSEELRLLYVALTRAKEQLFISVFMKKNKNKRFDAAARISALVNEISAAGALTSSVLRKCSSYMEWIAAAAVISDDNRPLLEAIGMGELSEELSGYSAGTPSPPVKWVKYPKDDNVQIGNKDFIQKPPDTEKVRSLRERYSYEYPNKSARSAAKRSVTEIVGELNMRARGDRDPMFYPQLGSLSEQTAKLTAAQRGTYTHLFMELADYENAEKDVKAELERLTSEGLFTEREAKGVYVNAVERFFGSDFYMRVKRSEDIRREMQFLVIASDAGLSEKYGDMIAPDGMLQGICDCIFAEDDGYVLVDYKTDGFNDISELDKYAVQLELYKAALDLLLPKPVKACYIYSFKLSEGKELSL